MDADTYVGALLSVDAVRFVKVCQAAAVWVNPTHVAAVYVDTEGDTVIVTAGGRSLDADGWPDEVIAALTATSQ